MPGTYLADEFGNPIKAANPLPVQVVISATGETYLSRTVQYRAKNSGTGYTTLDLITRTDIFDVSTSPATQKSVIWFNETTNTTVAVPNALDLTYVLAVDGSTETTLAAVLAKLSADPATQTTLAALLAKFGSLGQKNMSGSAPVVISSDQSAVSVDTELPAAVLLADAKPVPTTSIIGTAPMLYDGTTLNFQRGNTNATLLSSAIRTSNATSALQTNYNGKGIIVILDVTVASGSGGLTVRFIAKNPASGNDAFFSDAPTAITAAGTYIYVLYPEPTTAIAAISQIENLPLPRDYYVRVNHADASNYTYSLGKQELVG